MGNLFTSHSDKILEVAHVQAVSTEFTCMNNCEIVFGTTFSHEERTDVSSK